MPSPKSPSANRPYALRFRSIDESESREDFAPVRSRGRESGRGSDSSEGEKSRERNDGGVEEEDSVEWVEEGPAFGELASDGEADGFFEFAAFPDDPDDGGGGFALVALNREPAPTAANWPRCNGTTARREIAAREYRACIAPNPTNLL
jgi:hypothetical protein